MTMDLTMTNLTTNDLWCAMSKQGARQSGDRPAWGAWGGALPLPLQDVGGLWGWGWPRARSSVAIAHLADHVPCRQPPMSGKEQHVEQWRSQGGRRSSQRMVLHWANWGTERSFCSQRSARLQTPGGLWTQDPGDPGGVGGVECAECGVVEAWSANLVPADIDSGPAPHTTHHPTHQHTNAPTSPAASALAQELSYNPASCSNRSLCVPLGRVQRSATALVNWQLHTRHEPVALLSTPAPPPPPRLSQYRP
jgi:hypothetical protein